MITVKELSDQLNEILRQQPNCRDIVVMEEHDGYCWVIDNVKYDHDEQEVCILVTDEP